MRLSPPATKGKPSHQGLTSRAPHTFLAPHTRCNACIAKGTNVHVRFQRSGERLSEGLLESAYARGCRFQPAQQTGQRLLAHSQLPLGLATTIVHLDAEYFLIGVECHRLDGIRNPRLQHAYAPSREDHSRS